MLSTIRGIVTNGVVVPDSPLPEGARVEIQVEVGGASSPGARQPMPGDLRKMPREQRQAILAAAAEMAEQDYRNDKELTGFEAFSEEQQDDDESDPASR